MARLEAGKLPPELLKRLLDKVRIEDPRVLLGPAIGADAALIDCGDTILVVKSDPVTFATDMIGWYAVHVNANDIACMGATPKWFVASLLLPEGTEEQQVEAIFRQITDACRSVGASLVGGHTEVTIGLPRPVMVGAMLGEVPKGREVRPDGARVGDALVLTKGIAIEGTALLARDAAGRLTEAGSSNNVMDSAKDLLLHPGISVVRDAHIACNNAAIHALHDPTEGGVATGIWEMASASQVGFEVNEAQLQASVLPETHSICRALGLDPLGLLASGALLIVVAPQDLDALLASLQDAGIPARQIGRAVSPENSVTLKTSRGECKPMPVFVRDELARFLSS